MSEVVWGSGYFSTDGEPFTHRCEGVAATGEAIRCDHCGRVIFDALKADADE